MRPQFSISKCYFHCRSFSLSSLLQTTGIFLKQVCYSSIELLSFTCLKAAAFTVRGYWPMLFSIVTSLLFVVFIERSIFSSSRNLLF